MIGFPAFVRGRWGKEEAGTRSLFCVREVPFDIGVGIVWRNYLSFDTFGTSNCHKHGSSFDFYLIFDQMYTINCSKAKPTPPMQANDKITSLTLLF